MLSPFLRGGLVQRHLVLITMILLGIAAAGVACHRHKNPLPPPEEASIDAPEMWLSAGEPDAGSIAHPMPKEPFKGQKKKCDADEVSINGGCWMELVRKPGTDACGSKAFLHEGRCYVPVQEAKRPPTSYGE